MGEEDRDNYNDDEYVYLPIGIEHSIIRGHKGGWGWVGSWELYGG